MTIISLGSMIVTLVGFGLAIWQILKTKSVALAARDAALQSSEESRREFRRFVLATARRYLAEAKSAIDAAQSERAALRLGDLADQIAQLKESDPGWSNLLQELRSWETKTLILPLTAARKKKWELLIQSLHEMFDSSHGPFKSIQERRGDDLRREGDQHPE